MRDQRTLRPRYSVADLTELLWRERLMLVMVFALILAAGTGFALTLPKTYTAQSSLLVKLGQEYVYEPRAGDAARGTVPAKDQVVQSEMQILSSEELKRRVIRAVGLQVVDPELATAWASADSAERREIEGQAIKILNRGLGLASAPETGVIQASFKHKDPDAAALILNTLIDSYLQYRKEVFVDVTSPQLERQKQLSVERLAGADAAYEAFLEKNGVTDFATQKAALASAYQSIFDDKIKTEAQLREVEGKLAALRARQGEAPTEILIQRDLDLSLPAQLLKLRGDRQDLLSRYTPDAAPIKELDSKIAQLDALIASGRGVGEKDRRLGANPVWQDIESQRIGLESQASALIARRNEDSRILADIGQRQLRLTKLESEHLNLAAERDVLQTSVRNFATREAENRAAQEIAKGADDSIRVVERAAPPAEGKSLKKVVFLLALMFAAFTALCAALLRVFTRRGFPTAGSAERTLGMPVLATATRKT